MLGFLELALSLKFLSVADLAYGWHILDREVFLALWIVIFALLGMYLMGKIRFSHDAPADHVGVGRFFMSLVSLSFAVYLLPGSVGRSAQGSQRICTSAVNTGFQSVRVGERPCV